MGNKASDNAAKSVYLPSRTTFHKTQGSMKTEDQRFVKRVQSQACLSNAERQETKSEAQRIQHLEEALGTHANVCSSGGSLSHLPDILTTPYDTDYVGFIIMKQGTLRAMMPETTFDSILQPTHHPTTATGQPTAELYTALLPQRHHTRHHRQLIADDAPPQPLPYGGTDRAPHRSGRPIRGLRKPAAHPRR